MKQLNRCLYVMGIAVLVSGSGAAGAQSVGIEGAASAGAAPPQEGSNQGLQEIVVTAQKRQESLMSVPMSVGAVSGEDLEARGVVDVQSLARFVPGLQYTYSLTGTPVYTIRGIGFYDTSFGGKPSVSVYTDEVPLPFPLQTVGADLDLQRVEVLKGPQGTLFGENATGGAINYIAAKPTADFQSGIDFTHGNFDATEINAFISGPLSDTLAVRVAVDHAGGGAWQESYTRHDSLGDSDLTKGRVLATWTPDDRLKVGLSLNGFVNNSDTQAGQFVGFRIETPAGQAFLAPGVVNYPLAPANDRAADWLAGQDYRHHDHNFQTSVRVDYQLQDNLALTSLSSFDTYHGEYLETTSGIALPSSAFLPSGRIKNEYQELRLAGNLGERVRFVVGGNYEHDAVSENSNQQFPDASVGYSFVAFGFGTGQFVNTHLISDQTTDTYAGFGNLDFQATDSVTLHAGARFTQANIHFSGCATGDQAFVDGFGFLGHVLGGVFPPLVAGQCATLNDTTFVPGLFSSNLDENNVSWRTGADWTPTKKTLLYVSVNKGFKQGMYPNIGASSDIDYKPVTQEAVLAYEAGFKSRLLNDTLNATGAVFFYDYTNKQLLGTIANVFGFPKQEINIPKSRLEGAELELTWLPISDLTLKAGATYVHSKVTSDFFNYTVYGDLIDFKGEAFPFTPAWQGLIDAEYRHRWNSRLTGFVGPTITAQSKTSAGFGNIPDLHIAAYSLIDLRAGLESDDRWRLSFWVHNLADTYYWTNVGPQFDQLTRYTGKPRTFGVTFGYRFN